jgi:hypothetical protein
LCNRFTSIERQSSTVVRPEPLGRPDPSPPTTPSPLFPKSSGKSPPSRSTVAVQDVRKLAANGNFHVSALLGYDFSVDTALHQCLALNFEITFKVSFRSILGPPSHALRLLADLPNAPC